MNIYLLKADANHYQNLILKNEKDCDLINSLDGRGIQSAWKPMEVEIFRGDENNSNLPVSDFPALASHLPVFSEKAINALIDILAANGEILPLKCTEAEYFAYNVTNVIDALDQNSSQVTRFQGSGRIMDIRIYAFHHDKLHGVGIFKLPETVSMDVYVDESFFRRVRERNLLGFSFVPLNQ